MPVSFKQLSQSIVAAGILISAIQASASHMLGDEFSYVYVGDSAHFHHYRVQLNIYADCLTGAPAAVLEDNPAYFSIFDGAGLNLAFDSTFYSLSEPVPASLVSTCGYIVPPDYCTLLRTFIQDIYLPVADTTGFTIVYQRCCRNATLANITDPANAGSTFYCTIPPSSAASYNNSAVFANEPQQFVCINKPLYFDCSATDPDGDSLSYSLSAPLNCCESTTNSKPIPTAPPFDSISYVFPFSSVNPMTCSVPLTIDPVTGMITGTPSALGRYSIAVTCSEWRHGVLINTVRREFEYTAIACDEGTFKPFAGDDTAIMVGDSIQFDVTTIAVSYLWSPATYLSDSASSYPLGIFPVAGTFPYVLTCVNDSGCTGKDTIVVSVLESSEMVVPGAFSPNGDGKNDVLRPLSILNSELISFKVFDRDHRLLFTASSIDQGWDGTYHGVKQDVGAYYWELLFKNNAGLTKKMAGEVALIR